MECLSKKLLRNICHTRRHYSEILRLCPDITGGAFFYGVEAIEDTYGAFGANMSKTHNYSGHTVGDKSWPELRIYASNSNGIYGRSYSVSVPAAYSLIIIRT